MASDVSKGDMEKTSDHWSSTYESEVFARREWIGHPLAIKRMQETAGGHRTLARWFTQTQMPFPKVKRGLGIGVGVAVHENEIVQSGAVEQYDYVDVSQAGLDLARRSATEMGIESRINFICGDINQMDLPANHYDVITFMASLHHISELEKTLRTCERALAPGGVLWAFEYIGPDRFAYPDHDADIARRIYRILAPELHLPGEPELKFPSPEDVVAVDPTEAIHSSEIVETMRRIWPDLEFHGQYGSLSFMIMWCLNYNAIYDTQFGFEAYGTILDIETALVDSGKLPHYFANLIARKPTNRQRIAKSLGIDIQGPLYRRLQRLSGMLQGR